MFRSTPSWTEIITSLSVAACLVVGVTQSPASAQVKRSCQEIEAFMRNARMTAPSGLSAVIGDGTLQHRVFFHTSDEHEAPPGRFRDTWKANVAAYELSTMLEINIMPPYVERNLDGKAASISWGLDDVIMDDGQRNQRSVQPPDLEAWNKQMYVVQVFDELINNRRAPSDLLITGDWRIWILAPSQGFRPNRTIQNAATLVKCDRKLLSRMRTLSRGALVSRLGTWLTMEEIEALHARAREIVEFFDREVGAKGEANVLFDWDRSGVPCAL